MTFSELLKTWRQTHAIKSTTAAAKILNVPVDTYRGWERGRHTPSSALLTAIKTQIEK